MQQNEYDAYDDRSETFFNKMDDHIQNLVKGIEKKLDSVMKEREQAVKIIEDIVKQNYNSQYQ